MVRRLKGDHVLTLATIYGGPPTYDSTRVSARVRTFANLCYRRGLTTDPSMEGHLVLDLKIGPNGEVDSADVQSMSGITNEVAECVTHKVRLLSFDPPHGETSVRVPIRFAH